MSTIKNRILTIWISIAFLVGCIHLIHAAKPIIYQAPELIKTLEDKWAWAKNQSKQIQSGAWIGYAIPTENNHNCRCTKDAYDFVIQEYLEGADSSNTKRMSILFRFDENTGKPSAADQVTMNNYEQPVDLKKMPLYWLNDVEINESFGFLEKTYRKSENLKMRKSLISCLGIHKKCKETTPFLKQVIQDENEVTLRKNAVFWLSQQNANVLPFLVDVCKKDPSQKVRKQAVFAISLIDNGASTDKLIDLAKSSTDLKIRETAIFWLGQKASKKATASLKEMVYDESLTSIQKKTVFALSQQENNVELLIDIAKTHPNPKIRKQAIFWLGQSNDKRALDAIIALVKEL